MKTERERVPMKSQGCCEASNSTSHNHYVFLHCFHHILALFFFFFFFWVLGNLHHIYILDFLTRENFTRKMNKSDRSKIQNSDNYAMNNPLFLFYCLHAFSESLRIIIRLSAAGMTSEMNSCPR
jgi:hypothetical protein